MKKTVVLFLILILAAGTYAWGANSDETSEIQAPTQALNIWTVEGTTKGWNFFFLDDGAAYTNYSGGGATGTLYYADNWTNPSATVAIQSTTFSSNSLTLTPTTSDTLTNGTFVCQLVLDSAALGPVEVGRGTLIIYDSIGITGAPATMSSVFVRVDGTVALGGDWDAGGYTISNGVFVGDGSGLTGIVAAASAGVSSFNSRTGVVVLAASDISGVGAFSLGGNVDGNAKAATNLLSLSAISSPFAFHVNSSTGAVHATDGVRSVTLADGATYALDVVGNVRFTGTLDVSGAVALLAGFTTPDNIVSTFGTGNDAGMFFDGADFRIEAGNPADFNRLLFGDFDAYGFDNDVTITGNLDLVTGTISGADVTTGTVGSNKLDWSTMPAGIQDGDDDTTYPTALLSGVATNTYTGTNVVLNPGLMLSVEVTLTNSAYLTITNTCKHAFNATIYGTNTFTYPGASEWTPYSTVTQAGTNKFTFDPRGASWDFTFATPQ